MCGIFGLLRLDGGAVEPAHMKAMGAALAHRGPDDFGFLGWRGEGAPTASREPAAAEGARVALGHRRLSILDLSEAGWQPMSSPDGRLHLAFNGEIYNYLELKAELEGLGHAFRSHSDSEVLLAAYAQWGPGAISRFVGMFAFALLDLRAGEVFMARDPFGIKPLYYAAWEGGMAFASELPALLALPHVGRKAHPQRVYDFLRFGVTDHGGETMLEGVRQLPAGHTMTVPLVGPAAAPKRYWQPPDRQGEALPFEAAAERLRALFLDSVRLHLRSDVPIGAALSGGIDSSAIVCAMRHLEPDLELHAFSYMADDEAVNEARWVAIAAEAAGAKVHPVTSSPEELVADLSRLIAAQGEPFASTTIYAQHRVFRRAREAGITVMLDGQGADELLGGYVYYAAARLASLVRQGRFAEAMRFYGEAARRPGLGGRWLALRALDYLSPPALQEPLRRLAGRDLTPGWMNRDWFERAGTTPLIHSYTAAPEVLRATLARTLEETSLPHLLRYEDRNSMAHAIESRVPFLTAPLAEFLLALPEHYMVDQAGTGKAVFRRAMRGIVPDAILDRQDKIGFATPERRWLTSVKPWVDGVLASEAAATIGPLAMPEVRRSWQAMAEGRQGWDQRAWRWINLIEWTRLHGVRYD